MTKARRVIAEAMPTQDVVIEVLDARMPRASENPVLDELRGQKPCIKVLNKADLADPEITQAWLRFFEAERPGRGQVLAIALRAHHAESKTKIPALCKRLAPHRSGPGKTVRAMIVGIPNVGKSTLINTLMGRKVAKVGDEPAVTKGRQQVTLENGMTISDNPGILWPDLGSETTSYRLALGGAIPDVALDFESVGTFAARFFLERHPAALTARYKLDALPEAPAALLEAVGRRRGCLKSGGVVDLHKAADLLIHDYRAGALGRISLEEPPQARE